MLIQIQPIQIPGFWEVIKFAAIKSDGVKDVEQKRYCVNLLQDLLSGKKSCFIAQEGNKISFVIIIEFRLNTLKEYKYLYFTNLYSFDTQKDVVWKDVFIDLYKIAKYSDCKAIIGESNNEKVAEINSMVGAECIAKKYAYYL